MNYTYYRNNFIQDNILLSNTGLDDIFEILKNKDVIFQINSTEKSIYLQMKNQIYTLILQNQMETNLG